MSIHSRLLILVVVLCAWSPNVVLAQGTGRLGLSIGYPTSLGLLWQATTQLGIRPELAFDFHGSETTSNSGFVASRFSSDSWQIGVGLSVLVSVYRDENLSLYVGPRYIHHRGNGTTSEVTSPPGVIGFGNGDTESTTHTLSGSLGVRYALGTRLGVFGELGVNHQRAQWSSPLLGDGELTQTGIRNAIGVVFLF